MTAAGISAVAAMSLGTAITVSALAVLTASARGGGLKALIGDSPWYRRRTACSAFWARSPSSCSLYCSSAPRKMRPRSG